jgi:low affinity Fe/Cu permease
MEQLAPRGDPVDRADGGSGRSWLHFLVGAVVLVAVCGLTGPILALSDVWQLFIDTAAAVVVLWTVFVIEDRVDQPTS